MPYLHTSRIDCSNIRNQFYTHQMLFSALRMLSQKANWYSFCSTYHLSNLSSNDNCHLCVDLCKSAPCNSLKYIDKSQCILFQEVGLIWHQWHSYILRSAFYLYKEFMYHLSYFFPMIKVLKLLKVFHWPRQIPRLSHWIHKTLVWHSS